MKFSLKKLLNFDTYLSRQYQLKKKPLSIIIDDLLNLECLFVLSTGRCGTKLLTNLFQTLSDTWVEHSPFPELAHQSFIAYQLQYDTCCLQSGFLHARLDLLKQVYSAGLFYIETNNRISLYAEAIASFLPKSKFIHLIRHPAEFVRSGMRRGYYHTMPSESSGHLIPNPTDEFYEMWPRMDRLEQIAWQWERINQEISRQTAGLDSARIKILKSDDLFNKPKIITDIFDFIGKKPSSEAKINKILSRPVNAQKTGNFPKYYEWSNSDKKKLSKFAPSAYKYGFEL